MELEERFYIDYQGSSLPKYCNKLWPEECLGSSQVNSVQKEHLR